MRTCKLIVRGSVSWSSVTQQNIFAFSRDWRNTNRKFENTYARLWITSSGCRKLQSLGYDNVCENRDDLKRVTTVIDHLLSFPVKGETFHEENPFPGNFLMLLQGFLKLNVLNQKHSSQEVLIMQPCQESTSLNRVGSKNQLLINWPRAKIINSAHLASIRLVLKVKWGDCITSHKKTRANIADMW